MFLSQRVLFSLRLVLSILGFLVDIKSNRIIHSNLLLRPRLRQFLSMHHRCQSRTRVLSLLLLLTAAVQLQQPSSD
ncbi:hypothetical protein Pgy4_42494, partial [Pseudomonas savastanoi pv. glycinea str. race 4]